MLETPCYIHCLARLSSDARVPHQHLHSNEKGDHCCFAEMGVECNPPKSFLLCTKVLLFATFRLSWEGFCVWNAVHPIFPPYSTN